MAIRSEQTGLSINNIQSKYNTFQQRVIALKHPEFYYLFSYSTRHPRMVVSRIQFQSMDFPRCGLSLPKAFTLPDETFRVDETLSALQNNNPLFLMRLPCTLPTYSCTGVLPRSHFIDASPYSTSALPARCRQL